jgi:hypothetical protein
MSRAALICATALALLLGAGAAHAASVPPNVAHCISGVQKLARQAERIVRAQKSYLPRDFYRMSDGVYHCQEYKEEHILAYMRECIRTLRKSSRADCGITPAGLLSRCPSLGPLRPACERMTA